MNSPLIWHPEAHEQAASASAAELPTTQSSGREKLRLPWRGAAAAVVIVAMFVFVFAIIESLVRNPTDDADAITYSVTSTSHPTQAFIRYRRSNGTETRTVSLPWYHT